MSSMPHEYDDTVTLNGTIRSTRLGIEDHGIPTFNLNIGFGNSVQGFGNYDLRYKGHQTLIFDVLKALEVESWEKLKGINVRVKREGGLLRAIGHIVKDQWVTP